MANEFKIKKGLIINGSGSTILDIQGSQGQLFSVTDNLSGSLFSVNDISGLPILQVSSDDSVKLGTFNAEAIKVSGSTAIITGSLFGTSSFALTASFVASSSYALSSSFATTSSFSRTASFALTASFASNIAPGGATTQIQYNNAGVLAGTSALTFDGTTITANPISATGYFIPQNAIGGLSTVGADYTITEPGIYRFTSMDTGGARYINFPNPASKSYGQTIIIINSDALYAGYYDTTNSPESSLGVAITLIGAGIVDTFVNIDSKWIRTARRP